MWDVAQPRNKKFKLFLMGPPGCFKTRLALRLANNGNFDDPAAAVIDTEFGTDHYAGEFAFRVLQENDPQAIHDEVAKLIKKPGNIRTLIFDTFSVYYDALMEMWVDRFQLREKTSAGNKGEYYTFQPRDYVHINRDASKLVRSLLKCDLNIICVCQLKDQWEAMKIVGSVFDGWKRLPYYFDTIIKVEENKKKNGWDARIEGKDRSHSFKAGEPLNWVSDEVVAKFMAEKMGQDLAGGKAAAGYDDAAASTEKGKAAAKTTVAEKEKSDPADPATKQDAKQDAQKKEPQKEAAAVEATEPKKEEEPAAETNAETTADSEASEVIDNSPITKEKLIEIVHEKKKAKVNDPGIWVKMLEKYGVTTAKDMTMGQGDELIKDLIRGEIPT
jgi:hypothetical protein